MITLNLIVEPLTPIHIGTGDEIDPLAYTIDNEGFYRFDLDRLMGTMSLEKCRELVELIDRGTPLQVREVIQKQVQESQAYSYKANVTPKVFQEYQLKKCDIQNQLLVHTLVRDSLDWTPIIPGSSLKGSIRTAVVDRLKEGKQFDTNDRWRTEFLEPEILGYIDRSRERPRADVKSDPFRCLKVPDIHFRLDDVVVHRMFNKKPSDGGAKRVLEERSFNVTAETLEPGTSAPLKLQYDDRLAGDRRAHIQDVVPHGFEALREYCNRFYLKTLDEEESRYYRNTDIMKIVDRLRAEAQKPDRFLLRLGRFSGVFSVTLHDIRRPKAKMIRGQNKFGTTCYLTDDDRPLGWLLVRRNGKPS